MDAIKLTKFMTVAAILSGCGGGGEAEFMVTPSPLASQAADTYDINDEPGQTFKLFYAQAVQGNITAAKLEDREGKVSHDEVNFEMVDNDTIILKLRTQDVTFKRSGPDREITGPAIPTDGTNRAMETTYVNGGDTIILYRFPNGGNTADINIASLGAIGGITDSSVMFGWRTDPFNLPATARYTGRGSQLFIAEPGQQIVRKLESGIIDLQADFGNNKIEGRLFDNSGAPINGATAVITVKGGNIQGSTFDSSNGINVDYNFDNGQGTLVNSTADGDNSMAGQFSGADAFIAQGNYGGEFNADDGKTYSYSGTFRSNTALSDGINDAGQPFVPPN